MTNKRRAMKNGKYVRSTLVNGFEEKKASALILHPRKIEKKKVPGVPTARLGKDALPKSMIDSSDGKYSKLWLEINAFAQLSRLIGWLKNYPITAGASKSTKFRLFFFATARFHSLGPSPRRAPDPLKVVN